MKKNQLKTILLTSAFFVLIIVVGLYVSVSFAGTPTTPLPVVDLIGSRTGTSTTPYTFVAIGSSTDAYWSIGNATDQADFTVKMTAASTTASQVNFLFLGSNDTGCMTVNTSSTNGQIQTSDIRWFNLDPDNQLATSTTQSVENATTTYTWLPTSAKAAHFRFTNVDFECVRVNATSVGATSSIIVQLKAKSLFIK